MGKFFQGTNIKASKDFRFISRSIFWVDIRFVRLELYYSVPSKDSDVYSILFVYLANKSCLFEAIDLWSQINYVHTNCLSIIQIYQGNVFSVYSLKWPTDMEYIESNRNIKRYSKILRIFYFNLLVKSE